MMYDSDQCVHNMAVYGATVLQFNGCQLKVNTGHIFRIMPDHL